jgi:hypothetical protein
MSLCCPSFVDERQSFLPGREFIVDASHFVDFPLAVGFLAPKIMLLRCILGIGFLHDH